jgi:hypothetical protein
LETIESEQVVISRENMNEKVLELVKQSWREFKTDYREKKIKYYSNAKNPEGFIICWKEDDIVLQLSNYFYKNLKESELKDEGIEFHSQTELSPLKFGDYDFNRKDALTKLKDNLHYTPKPDFVITREDDTHSLWLVKLNTLESGDRCTLIKLPIKIELIKI